MPASTVPSIKFEVKDDLEKGLFERLAHQSLGRDFAGYKNGVLRTRQKVRRMPRFHRKLKMLKLNDKVDIKPIFEFNIPYPESAIRG